MAKKNKNYMVSCPDCNGRGEILQRDEDGEYMEKCLNCFGTGLDGGDDTFEPIYRWEKS